MLVTQTLSVARSEGGDVGRFGVPGAHQPVAPRDAVEVPAALVQEGIDVAVLYPTIGLGFWGITDRAAAVSVARAYNDWLAAYCAAGVLQLDLAVVVGIDLPETLSEYWHVPLGLDFADPETSLQTIVEFAGEHPLHAILSLDDSATELAARASAALGLAHNSPQSAEAARNKLLMRTLISATTM